MQYRVRFNFRNAANGYHYTEWYDTLDEAKEFARLADHFGELQVFQIEDEDGEVV